MNYRHLAMERVPERNDTLALIARTLPIEGTSTRGTKRFTAKRSHSSASFVTNSLIELIIAKNILVVCTGIYSFLNINVIITSINMKKNFFIFLFNEINNRLLYYRVTLQASARPL